MIGGGERMFMERLLGPGHQALLEDCLELYIDYYTRHCCDRTRLYSGVPETLERLSGKKLAVLSNKLQRLTQQILTALGIARFLDASRGGGAGLPLKPAPEPLLALIRDLRVEAGRTLMVGDKPADVNCARGAGPTAPRLPTVTATGNPWKRPIPTSSWTALPKCSKQLND